MNTQHDFYRLSVKESIKLLNANSKGLSKVEANQRIKSFGYNKLSEEHKTSSIVKYLRQFKDLMIILLLVSSVISFYLQDYRSSTILFIIVILNSIIGFVQEYKAEKILDSLKLIIHPQAKILRDGQVHEINSEDLVPGEIVYIEAGDAVPADLRVIKESNLSSNDFALTGESNPTRKFTHPLRGQVELGEKNNLLFMGTTIATGSGYGLVIGTGMNTELGKIAKLSSETSSELSPLQKELNNLATKLTIGTIILTGCLMFIAIREHFSIREAFIFAIGIAAAMVPQGLPAQVSIALSLASGRLAGQKAIIKKLSSVETLGATSIICTDKTGTLTKNEMTVEQFLIGQKLYQVSGNGYQPEGSIFLGQKKLNDLDLQKIDLFFACAQFACNAKISPPDDTHGNWYCIGDPTEGAMISLAAKAGLDLTLLEEKSPELLEYSFDSVRKRMSSIRKYQGQKMIFCKGSPQSILEKCQMIWDGQKVRKITTADNQRICKNDDAWAKKAMRNLALAYRVVKSGEKLTLESAEENLVFLGLVSMVDPPRSEVKEALKVTHGANIKVIIITGDYALTAEAIAEKIGLASTHKIKMFSGTEIREMSDIQLKKVLEAKYLIFARTSPEDKLRIVNILKSTNHVIAVTGDGINDAPALKAADIGVAMGKTGTDVAKESAEIILLDDSFHTLVMAIKEGRIIFQNLKKTILSCTTSNGGELFAVLISLTMNSLFQVPIAITAIQILAIDLIAEMFPLTALTWDKAHPGLMKDQPRNIKEHLLKTSTILDLIWSGFLMGGLGYLNYFLLIQNNHWNLNSLTPDSVLYMRATTLTYVTIVCCQFANILSRRSGETNHAFTSYLWSNPRLITAFGISFFCILNIVYNPFISYYFSTSPLQITDWLSALFAGLCYFLIREAQKQVRLARIK